MVSCSPAAQNKWTTHAIHIIFLYAKFKAKVKNQDKNLITLCALNGWTRTRCANVTPKAVGKHHRHRRQEGFPDKWATLNIRHLSICSQHFLYTIVVPFWSRARAHKHSLHNASCFCSNMGCVLRVCDWRLRYDDNTDGAISLSHWCFQAKSCFSLAIPLAAWNVVHCATLCAHSTRFTLSSKV